MIVRKINSNESTRFNEIFAIAFEQPIENGPAKSENKKIHHLAAFDESNEEMMSTITISDYDINFDDNICKMGGIGGVASLPQYRRQGCIRACFENALQSMYKDGYEFSYLYPFSSNYYRKFGYESCVRKYNVTANLSLLMPQQNLGSFYLADSKNTFLDEVMSIDRVWESSYNMMVRHNKEDYEWLTKSEPAIKQDFTYIYFNENNIAKAYTTFHKEDQSDGRNLICTRFCFIDKDGYNGLMSIFKAFSSDHSFVKFNLPFDSSMQYLMSEWSMGAVNWEVCQAGMVRVINVENVLKKAKYIGTGKAIIKITDKYIKENNDVFTVYFDGGKFTSVERSKVEPDIIIDITTFSALISGVCNFNDAKKWFDGLQIINKDIDFENIFYSKPLLITEAF